jgi:hypothetical protein
MRLYQAIIEWFEVKAEQRREDIATRYLECRCGCQAINDISDCG